MALQKTSAKSPEHDSGMGRSSKVSTPPSVGGVFDSEPIYLAHGRLVVAGSELNYTVAATESCDPHRGITGFVNGFSAFKSSSRPFRNASALAGDITFSFGPVRNDCRNWSNNILNPQAAQVDAVNAIYADLPNNEEFLKLPHAKKVDIDRRRLVGHSMAGLSLARLRADEKIYLAACGFGYPTIPQLARDVLRRGLHALNTDALPMMKQDGFDSWATVLLKIARHHHRPDRTVGEMISCLRENIEETVANDSAKSAYLDLEEDILVPINSRKSEAVDDYAMMHGVGHCAPQHSPLQTVQAVNAFREKPAPPALTLAA